MISQQQIDDATRIQSLHRKREFLRCALRRSCIMAARGENVERRNEFILRHLRRVNTELKHGPGAYDRFLAYVAATLPAADGARKRVESPLIRYMNINF